jgi:peptide/nickel transport system substrate-binding protein
MDEPNIWSRSRSAALSRRRFLGAAATGAGVIALQAACGRGNGPNSSSQTGAPANQPRAGGQVAVRVAVDPFDWDMSRTGKTVPNSYGTALAYNSLLGYKFGPSIKYNDVVVQPELAQSWESPDAVTYTFHLRSGVKFANLAPVNGRDLSSNDVKWSYEYWSRSGQFADKKLPTGQFQWLFEGLDHIETPDASTLVVKFKGPFAPFATYAASRYNPIVAHESYEAEGALQQHLVGTGPWQLDTSASQKGTRWVFSRNPTYWNAGRPYLDKVVWLVVADDSSTFAAFTAKQLDLLDHLVYDPNTAETIKKGNPAAVVDQYVNPLVDHLHLNVRKPPLNDVRVRKAISLAMDRDEFIRVQTGGKGAWGMAGAFYDTFTQDEIKQMLKFDPAQAKQLLSDAGYANGLDLEFDYPGNAYGDYYLTEMQLLQAQLKKAGINLVLKSLDKDDYSTRRKKGDFVIELLPTQPAGEDIGSLAWAIFLPGEQSNYGGVDDPALTALLKQQQGEPDAAKRKDLIRQAVKRINAEMYWAQGPYHRVNFDFWQPPVEGYAPSFANIGWPLLDAWVNR